MYTGIYLRDLIEDLGIDMKELEHKQIIFEGADTDFQGNHFS